jgi:hypothetical protein
MGWSGRAPAPPASEAGRGRPAFDEFPPTFCRAMNFQPLCVFVQALRNTSLKLRGWPLISASIAARPVTSAVSPARRTLRSLKVALLYFVFPERREASHVALVSVSPEEWV